MYGIKAHRKDTRNQCINPSSRESSRSGNLWKTSTNSSLLDEKSLLWIFWNQGVRRCGSKWIQEHKTSRQLRTEELFRPWNLFNNQGRKDMFCQKYARLMVYGKYLSCSSKSRLFQQRLHSESIHYEESFQEEPMTEKNYCWSLEMASNGNEILSAMFTIFSSSGRKMITPSIVRKTLLEIFENSHLNFHAQKTNFFLNEATLFLHMFSYCAVLDPCNLDAMVYSNILTMGD